MVRSTPNIQPIPLSIPVTTFTQPLTKDDRFRFIRCPSLNIAARLEHGFIRAYEPINEQIWTVRFNRTLKRKYFPRKNLAQPSQSVLNSPVPEKDSHLLLYGERSIF